jgi:alpha-2-macroglobulin
VVAAFTNAENERHVHRVTLTYNARAKVIQHKLPADTIIFESPDNSGTYDLVALGRRDNLLYRKKVSLPHAEKIEPFISLYQLFHNDSLVKVLPLSAEGDLIETMSQRTKDSLFVQVSNPRKLNFRYQLFKNNRIIESGVAKTYSLKKKTSPGERYYLSLQYLWADSPANQNYDLIFARESLSVTVSHPVQVYPGQRVEFLVNVSDAFGKPVDDVDLTASALTKKFRYDQSVSLQNFEKIKRRTAFNHFTQREVDFHDQQKLAFGYWRKRLGLDSIAYYHFLYPGKEIFTHTAPGIDSLTQVAPYVTKNGAIQSPHYIYFGNELVYYPEVQTIEPYSFHAAPGKLDIYVRLDDQLLMIHQVEAIKGMKLIFSLDLEQLPPNVTSVARPPSLTEDETRRIRSHFMWVTRDHSQVQAFFQQGKHFRLMVTSSDRSSQRTELVGPFFPGPVRYHSNFDIAFNFKPGMNYHFDSNLIDRESMPESRRFKYFNFSRPVRPLFKDQVHTAKTIEEFWKSLELQNTYSFRKFPSNHATGKTGTLTLRESDILRKRRAIFLINLDAPDEYYVYPGQYRDFPNLTPGRYQAVIIYNDESYRKPSPIDIKAFGRTFYEISTTEIAPADEFSRNIMVKIKQWSVETQYMEYHRRQELQDLRETYYQQYSDYRDFTNGKWISGRVTSAEGDPIPGVNVIIKGTTVGTVTDSYGEYRIFGPPNAVLVISFIGYATREISTRDNNSNADVTLDEDVQQLSEVVVVAYGVESRRQMLASSVSVMQGRVAGISFVRSAKMETVPDSVSVYIRGVASLQSGQSPLVVVDGVIVSAQDIDQSKIVAIEILKSAQATALYGARGANGVILISTNPGTTRLQLLQMKLPDPTPMGSIEEATPGNALRKTFRDYAFWQPRLRTDKNGIARFKATFPDDLTAWNISVIAVDPKRRSTQAYSKALTYKPLTAQLAMPHFLTEGDSVWAIGKITNYTPDSVMVTEALSINGLPEQKQAVPIRNSVVKTIPMIGQGDSVSVKYEVTHKAYKDGELRKIPVLKRGSVESTGIFSALVNDTTFTIASDPAAGTLTIYAEADLVDVLQHEITSLKLYPYECNEQLASKLKALLAEKMIRDYKKEKFTHDRSVEKIIRKLANHQTKDGGWSWWGSGKSELWITLHIAEAFDLAEKLNYKIQYDVTGLREYLKRDHLKASPQEQIKAWSYLSSQGEKVMFRELIDTLIRKKTPNHYHRLLSQRLLQLNHEEPDWNWIASQRQQTLKGNFYWGEEKNSLFDNDIENTLLVYTLLAHKNPEHPDLLRIRNYFLEKRKSSWRNTYESARIIEVILPSLLVKNKPYERSAITITGDTTQLEVKTFPFRVDMNTAETLTISKAGDAPVYFTAYRQRWNAAPEKTGSDFILSTRWANSEILEAGKVNVLEVSLTVVKDAEYVMINVPIPAGCSYDSKPKSSSNGEVHREYDLQETRIYCETLKAGVYTYRIKLLPRYKGTFQLNPAKAEWMYFPLIFGREDMKQVRIR